MTSINGEAGKNGFKLRLDYEVTKQSTDSNKSTVRMVLYLYANTTGSYNQDGNAYWSLYGKKTYYTFRYSKPDWYKLGERTVDISHNEDGTKTVTLSGAWCSGISGGWAPYSLSVSGKVTLKTIPRATTPVVGTVTLGEQAVISLPRASTAFTHTLSYSFGSASGTIATGAGDSCRWTAPESLAAQIPKAASGKGTITCKTYKGGTLIGTKSVTFTATVPGSMKPEVAAGWAHVDRDNSGTKAEAVDTWVQGYSKARATFDETKITCKQGASIQSYAISYQGSRTEKSPYRTGTINATAATVRCTVTDSRGLSAWEDFPLVLEEYAAPALVEADLFRADENAKESDSGTHIGGIAKAKVSDLGGKNTYTLKGCWKAVGGSYGSGTEMQSGTATLVTGEAEISVDKSYTAKIVLTDKLGNTASYEEIIPTEKVAFHLRAGGKGAAFGKVAEQENVLELAEDWEMQGGKKVSAQSLQATEAGDLTEEPKRIAVLDQSGVVGGRTMKALREEDIGVYQQSDGNYPFWDSAIIAGDYIVANTSYKGNQLNAKIDEVKNGVGRSEEVYVKLPFPLRGHNGVLTGSTDRRGYYVGSVNRTSCVGFSFRLFDPYYGNAVGTTLNPVVRLELRGLRAQPNAAPAFSYTDGDATARDQAQTIAQSYVSEYDGGSCTKTFTYGPNVLYGGTQGTIRNGPSVTRAGTDKKVVYDSNNKAIVGGRMECDTFVMMILRGLPFEKSLFNSTEATCDYTVDLKNASNPNGYAWVKGLLKYMNDNPHMKDKRDIKFAADMSWLMWYLSGVVINEKQAACIFTDHEKAQKGDLFFERSNTKNLFDGISHVGFVGEDGGEKYRYEVSWEKDNHPTAVFKSKMGTKGKTPAYYARLNYKLLATVTS